MNKLRKQAVKVQNLWYSFHNSKEHCILFIIFYWGIAYSVGLVTLVLYITLYLKYKKKEDLYLFIFDLTILAIVVSISMLSILPESHSNEVAFLGLTAFFCSALLIFTLPLFVHSKFSKEKRKILNSVFLVISIVGQILAILTTVTDSMIYANILLVLMGLTIGYSMVILVGSSIKAKAKAVTDVSSIVSGILTLILLPIILFVDFGVFVGDMYSDSIKSIIFFPGFYLVLNLIFIISSRKQMIQKKSSLSSFVSYHSISKREIDVLHLLVQGKSYQDIADILTISLSTVKTHTSRLYQKTNTRNKVELAALVNKSTESTI